MAQNTKLDVHAREASHSRENRRLRRAGQVPGVLYGGGGEPVSFAVGERTLRHALAASGAVIELSIDGGAATPAVLKDAQRHPVRGDLVHVDMLRVDLNKPIHAVVAVEFEGADKAPGVRDGGVLEQVTRELTVEALPTDIPEAVVVDVSAIELGHSLLLGEITAPAGVTLLDDPETTVIASCAIPAVVEEDSAETETEVIGDAGSAAAEGGEAAGGADGE